MLLNKESKRETSSVVAFTSKTRFMGTEAVSSLTTNPRNTVGQVKRLIGKKFADPAVQRDLLSLPFTVVEAPGGGCHCEVQYLDKPTLLSPEQLLAMLLVDLRAIAEREQGGPVTEAVIAVPTYFTEPERHAVLAAAHVAGINCMRLLNETTANALAWGIYKTDLPEGGEPLRVVFVDVGFSATQVCVAELKKGQLAVLSNAWDRDLGGRNLDDALFDHFVKEFDAKHKLDVRSNPRASHRLRLACEKMKKVLTSNPEAQITVECLANDVDVSSSLTREVFEELAAGVLARLLVPVQKAVESAGLTPEAITHVEVVGGSSRVPALLRALTEFFGGREPSRTLNAKEAAARGCALQAAMLSPTFRVRQFEVLDSFPYGVQFSWDKADAPGGRATSVVFPAGSPVPSAKMLTFYRSSAFAIDAEYTPDSDLPDGAPRRIGSFDIGPFALPAGADKAKVKVKVMLNLNGVVCVESANMVEESEEETPAAAAAAAVDATVAAAEPVGEEEPAAGPPPPPVDEAMPDATAAEAAPKKKKVKKTAVAFTAHTAALSAEQLQRLYETECEMALQARRQEETNDAKNAVEAYVYSLRNALGAALAPYVRDEQRTALLALLDDAENWLYDEGEDQAKSVYVAKLAELQKKGAPAEGRASEAAARPGAAAALRTAAQRYAAAARAAAHLEADEVKRVESEAAAALAWLADKEAAQKALHKYDDPALVCADIHKKAEALSRVCEPIVTKPAPPPPAPEPKPEDKMETDATMQEEGAAPAADSPQENEPMQD